jgi:hypothetical protein
MERMMDNEIQLDQPLPDGVITAVRAVYAAPDATSYWTLLESRIMTRVSQMPMTSWWQVLDRWARAELIAAAAVLTIVGALFMRANRTELKSAYDAVGVPATVESFSVPAGALSERDGPEVRGATFSDVISQ